MNPRRSKPPVRAGEKERAFPKEILSFPNKTPRTIPAAIGKKFVLETALSSLPKILAICLSSSLGDVIVSLSPNLSFRSAEGVLSIPDLLTLVAVAP